MQTVKLIYPNGIIRYAKILMNEDCTIIHNIFNKHNELRYVDGQILHWVTNNAFHDLNLFYNTLKKPSNYWYLYHYIQGNEYFYYLMNKYWEVLSYFENGDIGTMDQLSKKHCIKLQFITDY